MQEAYDLEVERIIKRIKEKRAKLVCLQLPDGLKPKAKELADKIKQATNAEVIIWAGSNFGACDLATEVSRLGVDLLIAFGHSEWGY
ncbi:diphthamide synthesis protein [Candidatus Woesearchaeota archaeon]|nr:diphthamide synthesis protein [Candidatus Woesearchaeota archaeon]